MLRINLKNLLSPRSDVHALMTGLIQQLDPSVYIEDDKGRIVTGDNTATTATRHPVKMEEEIIGWVNGNAGVEWIAFFLNAWVQKELERKKLGNEVLTLYQEVNMVFDFSEKLARTIGPENIAVITLEEARQLIKSDLGVIILWNENSRRIEIPASFGESMFDHARLQGISVFPESFQQSEITDDLSRFRDTGLIVDGIQSIVYATLKLEHRVMGVVVLARRSTDQFSAGDLKFLVTLTLQSASAIESAILYERNIREANEREEYMRRMYEVTNKFVPHEFIGSLGHTFITDVQLGDKVEKIVTVLFSDIRDYTSLSEKMTPEENFSFVSSFNERMGPVIRANRGFINQYLGDAIMAIFPENASDAVNAALGMQNALQELNISRAALHLVPIRVGIGMHTGPLIMGITGDHERLDAATISDTVNTASRLESLTKLYGTNILLTEACINNLYEQQAFHFRRLGPIQLKGKQEPVNIYECITGLDDHDYHKKLLALPIYNEGLSEYFNKSFKTASDKFGKVLEIYPGDKTTLFFLGKANQYLDNGIPENWTGVEEMKSK
jgi:adenylate cyclase